MIRGCVEERSLQIFSYTFLEFSLCSTELGGRVRNVGDLPLLGDYTAVLDWELGQERAHLGPTHQSEASHSEKGQKLTGCGSSATESYCFYRDLIGFLE